jgi:hypothetical protein
LLPTINSDKLFIIKSVPTVFPIVRVLEEPDVNVSIADPPTTREFMEIVGTLLMVPVFERFITMSSPGEGIVPPLQLTPEVHEPPPTGCQVFIAPNKNDGRTRKIKRIRINLLTPFRARRIMEEIIL